MAVSSLNKANMIGLALKLQDDIISLFSKGLSFEEISVELDNVPLDIVRGSIGDYIIKNKLV